MAGASANGAAAAPMTLAELPLPELLALLAARGAAGTVHASAGEAARRLYLIDGRLAGVASSDQRDRLGQLLLALGLITQERLAEALAVQEQLAAPLGQILLRAGALDAETLGRALRSQAEEALLDLLQRDGVACRFRANVLPTDRPLTLRLELPALIAEAARRRLELAAIREQLGGLDVTPRHTGKAPPAGLPGPELHVLGEIDGRRDLAAVARAARLWPYQVAGMVARGVLAGYLAVDRTSPASGSPGPQQLADGALAALRVNDVRRAWDALVRLREAGPATEVRTLAERVERTLREVLAQRRVQDTEVPQLVTGPMQGVSDLRPVEAFLLSRVNGRWTVTELRRMVGVGELEFRVAVESLLRQRLIDLGERRR